MLLQDSRKQQEGPHDGPWPMAPIRALRFAIIRQYTASQPWPPWLIGPPITVLCAKKTLKKNPGAVSSSTTMTSFKHYLAEIMVSKEEFEGMPAKIKANYRINGYNEWLKLKNSQTAPGTVSVALDGTQFFTCNCLC